MNNDRLSARLLTTFLGELDEQLRALNADLLALESDPVNSDRLRSVFRVVHTLKGAARAAGVPLVERACHSIEPLLADARDGRLTFGGPEFRSLFAAADAMAAEGARIRAEREQKAATSPAALLHRKPESKSVSEPSPDRAADAPAAQSESGDGQIRIEAEKIGALIAPSGQILALSQRVAKRSGEIRSLADAAGSLAADWKRTGRAIRILLEHQQSASLLQAVASMDGLVKQMARETSRIAFDAREDAASLARDSENLMYRSQRLQMRPFSDACEALPRTVRDLAQASGKQAQIEIAGGDVEADRAVLDALREAILHLVRNAVDHGIELPPIRERLGKNPRGLVKVTAMLAGDRLIITVTDDGAGLDVAGLRAELDRRGIVAPDDDRDMAQMLFHGGLSTRSEATTISGRGVGLDLVRDAADRIQGSVTVTWVQDVGTTFTIECPPTLTTMRVILVALGAQTVAIPMASVERLVRVRGSEIRHIEGQEVLPTSDGAIRLVALARVLPPLTERPISNPALVLILRAGGRRVAVVVDELLAAQEIVRRPIGGIGRGLAVSGATVLGSGRVALVLDPVAVVNLASGLSGSGLTTDEGEEDSAPARRRVLVVDDSITTRTLEQSVLEAAGYDVHTAVDGLAAWRMLQESSFDLVVADVEMPRMDGFALCEAIRSSEQLGAVPVVLVTALESIEHRTRGLELGADAYIGKSSFDQQSLLETVEQLLGASSAE